MIIKTFDNGWGSKLPAKQFEQHILDTLISTAVNDSLKTVLINSTWYTDEFHQYTLAWLRTNEFDRIILVSMLDPAIPQIDWFKEFDKKVITIGYYNTGITIDYWALLLNKYYKGIDLDVLLDYSNMNTAYLCLNRKPHRHRKILYEQLLESNLLDYGLVSLGGVRTLALDVTVKFPDPCPVVFVYTATTFLLDSCQIKATLDRKSTRLNSSHTDISRMPSSA